MVEQLRVGALAAAAEVRVGDRVAADQHAAELDDALLARLAQPVAPRGQLHHVVEPWNVANHDPDRIRARVARKRGVPLAQRATPSPPTGSAGGGGRFAIRSRASSPPSPSRSRS